MRSIDDQAFQALVAPHAKGLRAHCYRMLGSVEDADDAVQETLWRAWRALPGFEGRSSLKSWLYRIATNCCLTTIERRPPRVLRLEDVPPAAPGADPEEPLMEPTWLEPFPDDPDTSPEARYDQREALELAFVAALQHLPPRQRAVLILRDVLGFSGAEVAGMLDTIPSSVYSLLQRAHRAVDERIPAISQQETLRAIGDEKLRRLVDRYVAAWEANDAAAVAALLTDDAVLAMPPRPTWFRGRDAAELFLARFPLSGAHHWRLWPTRANGQLAFATSGAAGEPLHVLQVLTLAPDGRIGEITAFLGAMDLRRFAGHSS